MGSKADYLETELLDHIFGIGSWTAPATVYIALFTTTPTTDAGGGGTEASGGSYARKSVTNNSTQWSRAASTVDNDNDIVFVTATANWGTINGFGIYDAATAGNLLYYGDLTTPKAVNNGDTAKILAGDLDISED